MLLVTTLSKYISQFYGIEIDDFACEIATLSLWLAEHQMNRKFKELFGDCKPALPLSKSGNIVCGNATRLDWEQVCPKGIKSFTHKEMEQMTLVELEKYKQLELQGSENEIYILGNPPYAGAKKQTPPQRLDMDYLYNSGIIRSKNIDYIFGWFAKAVNYIDNNSQIKFAFVSTNSICQGEQVSLAWPNILKDDYEIFFAHTSFKWSNNAQKNAAVTCVIVAIQTKTKGTNKTLYINNQRINVQHINAYLIDYKDLYIIPMKQSISKFPEMTLGSTALDGGNLILSEDERNELLKDYPISSEYIKPFLSGGNIVNSTVRYCIWVDNLSYEHAKEIPLKNKMKKQEFFI